MLQRRRVLFTRHQKMVLWRATTLERTRVAKSSVKWVLTLCSLLPLPITAMVGFGNISQSFRTMPDYHGQTAQVSAMNF